MSEVRDILELWNSATGRGEEIVLATVVRTEGSSYRKPGARMLLTRGGRHSGMISGGCLEAEVSRKAWWLTEAGPSVQVYGTYYDEDEPSPRGLGCGGKVYLLLERGDSATLGLEAMWEGSVTRISFALLTVIKSDYPGIAVGSKLVARAGCKERTDIPTSAGATAVGALKAIGARTLKSKTSCYVPIELDGHTIELFVEYVAPSPALFVFGAGDDALPIVEFAHRMGWHTTVADSRSHLATRSRFSKADKVVTLNGMVIPAPGQNPVLETVDLAKASPGPDDSAILMTHSYMQDRALLRALLPRELTYLGVLGPRLRTSALLKEVAPQVGLTEQECRGKLHSPAGLDLGAEGPVGIAFSIVAEVQTALHSRFSTGIAQNETANVVRRAVNSSIDPVTIPRKISA